MRHVIAFAVIALTGCAGLTLKANCSVEVDGTTINGGLSPDGKTCTVEASFSTLQADHTVKLVKPK